MRRHFQNTSAISIYLTFQAQNQTRNRFIGCRINQDIHLLQALIGMEIVFKTFKLTGYISST